MKGQGYFAAIGVSIPAPEVLRFNKKNCELCVWMQCILVLATVQTLMSSCVNIEHIEQRFLFGFQTKT